MLLNVIIINVFSFDLKLDKTWWEFNWFLLTSFCLLSCFALSNNCLRTSSSWRVLSLVFRLAGCLSFLIYPRKLWFLRLSFLLSCLAGCSAFYSFHYIISRRQNSIISILKSLSDNFKVWNKCESLFWLFPQFLLICLC